MVPCMISIMRNELTKLISFRMAFTSMRSSRRKQFKVFNPIIIFNTINMMNNFLRGKIPTKMFLHNKAVFKDIFFFSKWMSWKKNQYIATFYLFATFPVIMFIAFRKNVCYGRFNISFFKTSFSRILDWMSFVKTTYLWMSFYKMSILIPYHLFHNNLLKLRKLLSVCLKETVKFQHLLGALFLDKKNPFPSSDIILSDIILLSRGLL